MLTENKKVLREYLKTLKYSACLFSAGREYILSDFILVYFFF